MAATAPGPKDAAFPQKLLDEALRLKVDIAGRFEDQVRQAVRDAWIEENREALDGWNAWVQKHGLPYAQYRQP